MTTAVQVIDQGIGSDDPAPLRARFAELTSEEIDDVVEFAASSGAVRCVLALLDLGVSPDHEGELQASSFLEYAYYSRNLDAVRVLLERGASVTLGVPLVAAAQSGDPNIVQLLLDAGAPLDQGYVGFPTALGVATTKRDQPVLELLHSRGARKLVGSDP